MYIFVCIVIYKAPEIQLFRNYPLEATKEICKSGYLWGGGVDRKKTTATVYSSFKFCTMCIYDQIQVLKHLIKQPPTLYT